jgi:hypothetical protein
MVCLSETEYNTWYTWYTKTRGNRYLFTTFSYISAPRTPYTSSEKRYWSDIGRKIGHHNVQPRGNPKIAGPMRDTFMTYLPYW